MRNLTTLIIFITIFVICSQSIYIFAQNSPLATTTVSPIILSIPAPLDGKTDPFFQTSSVAMFNGTTVYNSPVNSQAWEFNLKTLEFQAQELCLEIWTNKGEKVVYNTTNACHKMVDNSLEVPITFPQAIKKTPITYLFHVLISLESVQDTFTIESCTELKQTYHDLSSTISYVPFVGAKSLGSPGLMMMSPEWRKSHFGTATFKMLYIATKDIRLKHVFVNGMLSYIRPLSGYESQEYHTCWVNQVPHQMTFTYQNDAFIKSLFQNNNNDNNNHYYLNSMLNSTRVSIDDSFQLNNNHGVISSFVDDDNVHYYYPLLLFDNIIIHPNRPVLIQCPTVEVIGNYLDEQMAGLSYLGSIHMIGDDVNNNHNNNNNNSPSMDVKNNELKNINDVIPTPQYLSKTKPTGHDSIFTKSAFPIPTTIDDQPLLTHQVGTTNDNNNNHSNITSSNVPQTTPSSSSPALLNNDQCSDAGQIPIWGYEPGQYLTTVPFLTFGSSKNDSFPLISVHLNDISAVDTNAFGVIIVDLRGFDINKKEEATQDINISSPFSGEYSIPKLTPHWSDLSLTLLKTQTHVIGDVFRDQLTHIDAKIPDNIKFNPAFSSLSRNTILSRSPTRQKPSRKNDLFDFSFLTLPDDDKNTVMNQQQRQQQQRQQQQRQQQQHSSLPSRHKYYPNHFPSASDEDEGPSISCMTTGFRIDHILLNVTAIPINPNEPKQRVHSQIYTNTQLSSGIYLSLLGMDYGNPSTRYHITLHALRTIDIPTTFSTVQLSCAIKSGYGYESNNIISEANVSQPIATKIALFPLDVRNNTNHIYTNLLPDYFSLFQLALVQPKVKIDYGLKLTMFGHHDFALNSFQQCSLVLYDKDQQQIVGYHVNNNNSINNGITNNNNINNNDNNNNNDTTTYIKFDPIPLIITTQSIKNVEATAPFELDPMIPVPDYIKPDDLVANFNTTSTLIQFTQPFDPTVIPNLYSANITCTGDNIYGFNLPIIISKTANNHFSSTLLRLEVITIETTNTNDTNMNHSNNTTILPPPRTTTTTTTTMIHNTQSISMSIYLSPDPIPPPDPSGGTEDNTLFFFIFFIVLIIAIVGSIAWLLYLKRLREKQRERIIKQHEDQHEQMTNPSYGYDNNHINIIDATTTINSDNHTGGSGDNYEYRWVE